MAKKKGLKRITLVQLEKMNPCIEGLAWAKSRKAKSGTVLDCLRDAPPDALTKAPVAFGWALWLLSKTDKELSGRLAADFSRHAGLKPFDGSAKDGNAAFAAGCACNVAANWNEERDWQMKHLRNVLEASNG